jgi:hypothetical protein
VRQQLGFGRQCSPLECTYISCLISVMIYRAYFLDRRTRIPCGPIRISWTKVDIATHTIGDMSTPPIGLIISRVARSKGSVGTARNIHGVFFRSVCGYHVRTMRITMTTVKTFKTGPQRNIPACKARSGEVGPGGPATAVGVTRLVKFPVRTEAWAQGSRLANLTHLWLVTDCCAGFPSDGNAFAKQIERTSFIAFADQLTISE